MRFSHSLLFSLLSATTLVAAVPYAIQERDTNLDTRDAESQLLQTRAAFPGAFADASASLDDYDLNERDLSEHDLLRRVHLLTAPVEVGWDGKRPKKKGTVSKGPMAGSDKETLRKEAEARTKEALEHANSHDPPRAKGEAPSQWISAKIRHGYDTDSSHTHDKAGRPGDKDPHVNIIATAANGYKKTMHIGQDGRVVPHHKRLIYDARHLSARDIHERNLDLHEIYRRSVEAYAEAYAEALDMM